MNASAPNPATMQPIKIWDISPPVNEQSEVFPGDTRYSQQLNFSLSPGCPVNVNRIQFSPHTGAHADAPMHYA
ncbi:MAG: cyclase family protein, partial [Polaromonas sp.]